MVFTHDLRIHGPQHVHRHAPDLAPRPVEADLDADPPTITMTVVPGEPLGRSPTSAQVDALAAAVETLWAIPLDGSAPFNTWRDDLDFARTLIESRRPADSILGAAYDAPAAWWHGPDPVLLRTEPTVTVLGHRERTRSDVRDHQAQRARSTSEPNRRAARAIPDPYAERHQPRPTDHSGG